MINLLPLERVIAFVSVFYAIFIAIFVAISRKWDPSQTTWGSITFAISGATVLQITLGTWCYFGWRLLWRCVPALNRVLFPDIGGEWEMEIHWHREGHVGVVNAQAIVRQNFLRLSMEVTSPNSDSQTLIALPKKDSESGRPILYYVYLVTPKAIGLNPSPPYHGAAILKFTETGGGELSGNYWTTEQTNGHFRLLPRNRPEANSRPAATRKPRRGGR